ncbi:MAG: host attachment protein [Hyphomicrobiales bacterium]|nr:host attachment protein [Hyphomicrobiales bacterium]
MTKFALPHGAYVFVGDGRKALFLRNDGDQVFPNLATERVLVDENPPTHDQGTDQPGRTFASAHSTRRSAMETPDWHEIEEHRFAIRVAAALEELVRSRGAPALLVVAPPTTLADLRRALHDDVKARLIGEIDKDLTNIPVWEIEKRLASGGAPL